MIKSFKVTNYVGDSITLELTRPDKTGFIVKSVDGLGPVKATINMTSTPTYDGALFNSARLDKRNIILSLDFMELPERKDENGKLLPYETIEHIRQKSYKYFPLKKKLHLVVETDNRLVETEGYVESNEPNIFSNQEGCTISILCPDSFFYSLESATTVFSGIKPLFEFPFSCESIEKDESGSFHRGDPTIEMSQIVTRQSHLVRYDGDVDVGVTIVVHAVDDVEKLVVTNETTLESMSIDDDKLIASTGSGITAGDTITIETRKGYKSITLLRDGETINILNSLGKNSKWFNLVRGNNAFRYSATGNGFASLQFSIYNKVVYEGV